VGAVEPGLVECGADYLRIVHFAPLLPDAPEHGVDVGLGLAVLAGGKHALRALAQSMARELGPQGIHVAHIVIDGAIDTAFIRSNFPERAALKDRDGILDPEAIAQAYWQLHCQQRSAWTHELDLRPWLETW
jgi:NAD(P)-dependent dehydrogenase (short-subunit alcohol dehydrogenase family)